MLFHMCPHIRTLIWGEGEEMLHVDTFATHQWHCLPGVYWRKPQGGENPDPHRWCKPPTPVDNHSACLYAAPSSLQVERSLSQGASSSSSRRGGSTMVQVVNYGGGWNALWKDHAVKNQLAMLDVRVLAAHHTQHTSTPLLDGILT
jgi:hypothetical protein